MAEEIVKIKISELPPATNTDGLYMLGVSTTTNESVKVPAPLFEKLKAEEASATVYPEIEL
jgi:hypothetical protein